MYAYDSGKRALADHLDRLGRKGTVDDGLFLGSYHIRYALDSRPGITIVIPTKDKVEVLRRCIESILNKTTYDRYSILVVDNGSRQEETLTYYSSLANDPRIRIISYEKPFNFSALNNFASQECSGEYLLFLNNDTEIITPDWLEEMLGLGQQDEIGAVGCLLLYGNETVQHGGVIVGIGGVAGHAHKFFSAREEGYFGRLKVVQNLSAVTAACMLVRKSVFDCVGGFSEELSHAFNDVDLCLKIQKKGYRIAYTPFARAYHHESISRGFETSRKKRERFNNEIRFMQQRWGQVLQQGDPYYNPNLTLVKEDFSLATDDFSLS
jgi:GT2 family glycosyltransferase